MRGKRGNVGKAVSLREFQGGEGVISARDESVRSAVLSVGTRWKRLKREQVQNE